MIYHSEETRTVTTITGNGISATVFCSSLNSFAPDEFVTKQALCRLFECSGRTIQRMVARRVLPSPVMRSGKRFWHVGTLGAWLADAAKRKQSEVTAEAARIRAILADRMRN
ncbi:MAG: hypothetical protein LUE17_11400 [Planctomycetaceae bacterium]|nr:hypothetical protein [Planctomycetaceae bacterium]